MGFNFASVGARKPQNALLARAVAGDAGDQNAAGRDQPGQRFQRRLDEAIDEDAVEMPDARDRQPVGGSDLDAAQPKAASRERASSASVWQRSRVTISAPIWLISAVA